MSGFVFPSDAKHDIWYAGQAGAEEVAMAPMVRVKKLGEALEDAKMSMKDAALRANIPDDVFKRIVQGDPTPPHVAVRIHRELNAYRMLSGFGPGELSVEPVQPQSARRSARSR